MRARILSVLYCLVCCLACNGQHKSAHNNAAGENVAKIDANIWVIFQDSKDNYWFGSDGKGVYRYDGTTWQQYSTDQGLCNDRVREIREDVAGNIYIGTMNGISRFDGRLLTTLAVNNTAGQEAWKLQSTDLWFKGNSQDQGPFRFDGQTLYQLNFPRHEFEDDYYKKYPGTTLSPYGVYTIYRDRKDRLWFGTSALGACLYDGRTHQWIYERSLSETPGGGSFGIRSIYEDREGRFWICNTGQRFTFLNDTSKDHFLKYTKQEGIDISHVYHKADPIYFQYILDDNEGNTWLSTYSDGLYMYDGKNMTHYPVLENGVSIKIISLYKDRRGTLWLACSANGIYKYNGKSFEKFL